MTLGNKDNLVARDDATPTSGGAKMPSRLELVKEAVARLDTAGVRSQLVALDTTTLVDLGMRLTDRASKITEAHAWLNQELGLDESNAIDDNAVYRFRDRFVPIYSQVRGEAVRRVMRLTVASLSDDQRQAAHRIADHRLAELAAEKLLETEDLSELDGKDISAAIQIVTGESNRQHKLAELELKRRQADARIELLEKQVEEKEQALQAAREKYEAQQQAAEQAAEHAKSAAASGATTDQIVKQVCDLLGVPA